jgi:hypothetical protein
MSFLLIIAAASAAISTDPLNPIEPADRGMLACFEPVEVGRTCQAIGRYYRTADGKRISHTVMHVFIQPLMKVDIVNQIEIRNNSVCGKVGLRSDFKAGAMMATRPLVSQVMGGISISIAPVKQPAPAPGKPAETCSSFSQGENTIFMTHLVRAFPG